MVSEQILVLKSYLQSELSEADRELITACITDLEIYNSDSNLPEPELPLRVSESIERGLTELLSLDEPLPDTEELQKLRIRRAQKKVNQIRDKHINSGVEFQGVVYQSDADSRENVNGAYSRANAVKAKGGGLPGDYRWFSDDYDFSFTAGDNSEHLMDADTVIDMGDAFSDRKLVLIKFAQAVKRRLDEAESDAEIDRVMGSVAWP